MHSSYAFTLFLRLMIRKRVLVTCLWIRCKKRETKKETWKEVKIKININALCKTTCYNNTTKNVDWCKDFKIFRFQNMFDPLILFFEDFHKNAPFFLHSNVELIQKFLSKTLMTFTEEKIFFCGRNAFPSEKTLLGKMTFFWNY